MKAVKNFALAAFLAFVVWFVYAMIQAGATFPGHP